jgi:hypothetical protein
VTSVLCHFCRFPDIQICRWADPIRSKHIHVFRILAAPTNSDSHKRFLRGLRALYWLHMHGIPTGHPWMAACRKCQSLSSYATCLPASSFINGLLHTVKVLCWSAGSVVRNEHCKNCLVLSNKITSRLFSLLQRGTKMQPLCAFDSTQNTNEQAWLSNNEQTGELNEQKGMRWSGWVEKYMRCHSDKTQYDICVVPQYPTLQAIFVILTLSAMFCRATLFKTREFN